MPTFQVTRREIVYIDRTYEIEADTADSAVANFDNANVVDEMIQDTHSIGKVLSVCDENGNAVEAGTAG